MNMPRFLACFVAAVVGAAFTVALSAPTPKAVEEKFLLESADMQSYLITIKATSPAELETAIKKHPDRQVQQRYTTLEKDYYKYRANLIASPRH